jgi:predicted nucleic acid-binding Zn ribbon protein
MSNPNQHGPRALSDILGELFTVRGYGRLRARQELEEAWNAVVGEPFCRQTQLGEVRRGVLNVIVAHSTLLEELAAFRKADLLAALQSGAPATAIQDIRFRVGTVALEVELPAAAAPSSQSRPGQRKPPRQPAPPRDRRAGKSTRSRGSGHNPAQA